MNKLMIALAATLGLSAAATVPAQAGSNWSVSAGVYTTAPTYHTPAPTYHAPAPTYYAPSATYYAPAPTYYVPRYYNPLPAISFSFGNTVKTRSHNVRKPAIKRAQTKARIRNIDRRIDRLENKRAKWVSNRNQRRDKRR